MGFIHKLFLYLQSPALGKVKGVRPCKIWYWSQTRAVTSFNEYAYAVKRRDVRINGGLHHRADQLDREFIHTPVGSVGPLGAAFRQYGEGQTCVQ